MTKTGWLLFILGMAAFCLVFSIAPDCGAPTC